MGNKAALYRHPGFNPHASRFDSKPGQQVFQVEVDDGLSGRTVDIPAPSATAAVTRALESCSRGSLPVRVFLKGQLIWDRYEDM